MAEELSVSNAGSASAMGGGKGASDMASNLVPVLLIGVMFFVFGFVTWLNGPLTAQTLVQLGEAKDGANKRKFNSIGGRVAYAMTNNFKLQAELGMNTSKPNGGSSQRVMKPLWGFSQHGQLRVGKHLDLFLRIDRKTRVQRVTDTVIFCLSKPEG